MCHPIKIISSYYPVLNQRSDRFYNITLVRPFVRACVRHKLISETAPRIFPKLGMKLGDNKGKK